MNDADRRDNSTAVAKAASSLKGAVRGFVMLSTAAFVCSRLFVHLAAPTTPASGQLRGDFVVALESASAIADTSVANGEHAPRGSDRRLDVGPTDRTPRAVDTRDTRRRLTSLARAYGYTDGVVLIRFDHGGRLVVAEPLAKRGDGR